MIEVATMVSLQWLYWIGAVVMAFVATYTWWVWRQVGGIQGAMMVVLFGGLSVAMFCLGLLHAGVLHVPTPIVVIVFRAMWPAVVVASVLLADAYASSKNDHRSFTSRSYTWYKRVTGRKERLARLAREARQEART